MRHQIVVFFVVVMLSFSVTSEISLTPAEMVQYSYTGVSEQERVAWSLENIAHEKGITSINAILAYIDVSNSADKYILDKNRLLAKINADTKVIDGPWPLTRWEYQFVSPELKERHASQYWDYPNSEYSRSIIGLGCLEDTPLYYGDIENDSANELVVFLGQDLLIFSPAYERIVFAELFDIPDWLSLEDSVEEKQYKQTATPQTYQYLSRVLDSSNTDEIAVGYRGYSKLFFGDFDGNGQDDIVVWRKFYQSNKLGETAGFSLLQNQFVHYERNLVEQASTEKGVTGEYLPQSTPSTIIQQWLSDKELTWQKGFPSLSECEGQEGQLIPEMHDPLLNDPEVLQ